MSNIVIGLGESDECVGQDVEYIARMGMIAAQRTISISPGRQKEFEGAVRSDAERLVRRMQMTRES